MDQPQTPPAQTPPEPPQAPPTQQPTQAAPPAQPAQSAQQPAGMSKGVKVLLWLVGGCAVLAILGVIAAVAFTWWGAKKVRKEMQKYTPNMEQFKENTDKLNQESEEWQKKSEEYRNSLPNPEDLQNQAPPGANQNYPPVQ